jgi:hypothetical protein
MKTKSLPSCNISETFFMNTKKAISILVILLSFIQFALSDGYKVPQYAYSLDVCDIDNDGDIDIIVGSHDQGNDTISILLNDGYGNFTISTLIRSNYSSVFCTCINEDDLQDIVTLTRTDSAWVFYPNYGEYDFGNSQIIYSSVIEIIKPYSLDEDNSQDFICYDWHIGGGFGALYNDGSGSFSHINIYTSPITTSEPDAGDVNGDSLNDILMTDYNVGVLIFYNQGTGDFEQQLIDENPVSDTYIFDIDNDGDNDLGLYSEIFMGNEDCYLKIFENQSGDFIFRNTIYFPTGTKFKAFADLNNDNYFDIIYKRSTWDSTKDSLYVVFNNHDYSFSSADRYFVHFPRQLQVVTADFDGNGYNDIAYTYYSSEDSVTILFNDGTGKFLENPLTGLKSLTNDQIDITVYPNPFNSRINIFISNLIQNVSSLNVSIYDLQGRIVKYLMVKDLMSSGEYVRLIWEGKDNQGYKCKPGIYFLKCRYKNSFASVKLILIN